MDGIVVLVLLLLVVAAFVVYVLWMRHSGGGGGCTTVTPSPCGTVTTTGTCFPSTQFPVKSGIVDLRQCSDHVYILGDRSKVHFITES